MTTKRTRWLGWVLTLAITVALLVPGSVLALPVNPPKVGMVCLNGPTFNLVATSGTIHTPDGNTVFMWSYADSSGQFQYPGPVLCVNQGDTVTVNLTNNLPEASSIMFPGQDSAVTTIGGVAGLLTREAAGSGGTVSYSFTASQPGTYLYQSGSKIEKQVEMGLYGALIVRSSLGSNYAYDASTQFDPTREYMLLLAEIDPDLHHAVETGGVYDATKLHNHYFTINGRSFPDTILDNGSALLPTQPYGALVRIRPTNGSLQPALIRMLNAGADNHPFHPHGNHTREIAQDGRPIKTGTTDASTEHFGETIGAGQTLDYLIRWDNQSTDTAGVPFNDDWNPVNNLLPVPQPNYQNLTFKDGNTFYSGSPYLGYKGTLPSGTVSQNICGEWYFPFHSHALDEFSNFDEGFGGMGTLLRVDPAGGCFATPTSTVIVGGVLKSGSVTALAVNDSTYYQVNPKTTTRGTGTMGTGATTTTVTSAAGFPTVNGYYIRIDSEVMQVTAGAGTTTWTVCRTAACRLGTALGSHNAGATITALANDWYAGFTGIPAGSQNLKVTYAGKNCNETTGTSCTPISTNLPMQTVKICNWTIAGVNGCSTANSAGWVTLPTPPQPIAVGSEVTTTWSLTGLGNAYIGTGAYKGQVRILVHTQRWTAPSPTAFSTWGNFMQIAYDAP